MIDPRLRSFSPGTTVLAFVFTALLAFAGCGDDPDPGTELDEGPDTGSEDVGNSDAGATPDTSADVAPPDTSEPDAGTADT